mmetsp:Transcript_1050/g.2598  ORF Transcript_1050/g.2598 Transcript_1050/m.2598 type:complete len:363 (+) Transcript_1050:1331-2419(+)
MLVPHKVQQDLDPLRDKPLVSSVEHCRQPSQRELVQQQRLPPEERLGQCVQVGLGPWGGRLPTAVVIHVKLNVAVGLGVDFVVAHHADPRALALQRGGLGGLVGRVADFDAAEHPLARFKVCDAKVSPQNTQPEVDEPSDSLVLGALEEASKAHEDLEFVVHHNVRVLAPLKARLIGQRPPKGGAEVGPAVENGQEGAQNPPHLFEIGLVNPLFGAVKVVKSKARECLDEADELGDEPVPVRLLHVGVLERREHVNQHSLQIHQPVAAPNHALKRLVVVVGLAEKRVPHSRTRHKRHGLVRIDIDVELLHQVACGRSEGVWHVLVLDDLHQLVVLHPIRRRVGEHPLHYGLVPAEAHLTDQV